MTEKELADDIRKAWTYAKAVGVGELFSVPVAFQPRNEFKALAIDPDTSYEELYLTGMRYGQYNVLLTDFAFFQFGLGGADGVRFAYYPNPFLGAATDALEELGEMRDFVEEGVLDVDEFLHRAADIRRAQHPPLVRYEYSKLQYVEATHPCSHMHLGFHGDNRWPVRRCLSAHAFALLVLRLFYLSSWSQAASIKSGKDELSLDDVLERARSDSRILYRDEFSEAEERRFHLF